MDPRVLGIAAASLGVLWVFAVEPLDPSKKRRRDYNPEPLFFQWKGRFEEYMGWRPQTRL
eukprot:CAMPEP_0179067056 /NCGR_PEP_ID=MMETSP0796-20121207/29294_1 /TAXON_ID=73915 /ORGANISM="Pyrodinium bahamense, Strain pbaha01" /LENGTH=59 /DNA_ID=CAMNT_0020764077 /DNA_START=92 /DNA_END=271 /DNA_ORIENTATION=-